MEIMENKLEVAIIGAGPSGIYAGEALLKKLPNAHITFIDALPTPFGLVRSGVAPDHFKIKEVSRVFEKTLSNERVTFLGNIEVDKHISIQELRNMYHLVILCHGTTKDRKLGITGEGLEGVYPATEFVGWYNAHPWFTDKQFNLKSSSAAVIIGQGNVALDIARIILKTTEDLSKTDISSSALESLKDSSIKDVYLVGRRGPLQIACTDKELAEFGDIENLDVVVNLEDLNLTQEEAEWLETAPKGIKRNFEILRNYAENRNDKKEKRLHILFNLSPIELLGSEYLERALFTKNTLDGPLDARKAVPTEETISIECSTLFKSVGYLGTGLAGLPFNESRGIYPNNLGAVLNADGSHLEGIYTSGWIKRGPSGVIGTNKQDSAETVDKIISDLPRLDLSTKEGSEGLKSALNNRDIRFTTYEEWKQIDTLELSRGEASNKCRKKFETVVEMLSLLK
jgi:ferredoxin--NADP+ reductase